MKYALSVEVKLAEVPDEEPMPTIHPGDDPMAALGGIATKLLNAPVLARQYNFQNAGFDFRKQIEIRANDFTSLAAIIGRFDNLVSDIEAEKLDCK